MSASWMRWAVLGVWVAGVAAADELKDSAKVEVVVQVVLASNTSHVLEPPSLAKMKEEFAKQNLRFTSFRLLQTDPVVLTAQKPEELKLPNGTSAKLKLLALKEGKATIGVDLRKVESRITLGREGSVFVHGGKHLDGELVLVFQPAPAVRPRRPLPLPQDVLRPKVSLPRAPPPSLREAR